MRPLDEKTLVAGQIAPHDVAALAAAAVTMVVNNRPDGEEPGQPLGAEIEAAARSAGLEYRSIPVAGGISALQIEAMAQALEATEGKMLAFCRSGTRSAYLWALARTRRGAPTDEIAASAAAAGYDLAPIRRLLDQGC